MAENDIPSDQDLSKLYRDSILRHSTEPFGFQADINISHQNEQYNAFCGDRISVQFQLSGDRCENLDGFNLGDEVKLDFSLRGREWQSPQGETRYFNSLDVWTIDHASASDQAGPVGDEPPVPDGPPPGFEDVPF